MKEKIERILSFISSDLQALHDDYFILRSCALILSGIPVERTSDLDLLVSHEDADHLKLVWADRMRSSYEPSHRQLFRSNFGRFDFGELDIEIMGGLEVLRNNEWKLLQIEEFTEISLGEQKIKIPTLEEQKRIFYFFGREKDKAKARLIEDFLDTENIY